MLARVLKIVAGIAAVAALGFAVYHFRLWEKDWSTIDDGWGSLIGSALGAFLAVVGALYVSKAEERRKKKAFEEFVRVAVQNLVVQASYLEAMAREPHKIGPTPDVQVSIISIQQRSLTDALAVFDREIANSRDGDYMLRRSIVALDSMLSETKHSLTAEALPLQILQNWHVAAYQVRFHATGFLEAFYWVAPIPSANLIAKTAEETVRAWKSWNIPVDTTALPHEPIRGQFHQPVHHAHA